MCEGSMLLYGLRELRLYKSISLHVYDYLEQGRIKIRISINIIWRRCLANDTMCCASELPLRMFTTVMLLLLLLLLLQVPAVRLQPVRH